MRTISDFPLAEWYLRRVCSSVGIPFVDLPISFYSNDPGATFVENQIVVGKTARLSQTLFQIFGAYIQHIEQISGPCNLSDADKVKHINAFLSIGRDLTYGSSMPELGEIKEAVTTRLNRDAFVWILLRDVICPAFDASITNTKVIASRTPYVDGAQYFQEGDIDAPTLESQDFPFIYLNLDVENLPCRAAYLLHEAIKAQGINPKVVIYDILSKAELRTKVEGLAKAAFVEDNLIDNFMSMIGILVGYTGPSHKTAASTGKVIQSQFSNGSWWLLGLTERQLEPARGFDWQPYNELEPMTNELWEKIEREKQRRGLEHLPMELLLRVQSEEFKQRPDLIIQGLLADHRIW